MRGRRNFSEAPTHFGPPPDAPVRRFTTDMWRIYFMIYAAEKAITPRATHTCVASARSNAGSRTRAAASRVRAQQRVAYARRQGAHPKTSEAPTHFGPPRAVRTACRNLVKHQRILGHPCRAVYRNLVKHQRILGIPNLSATCGVRPLPAVSVRDRRCVGRACKNRHEHTLAKTVTNTRAGSVLFSIPGL